MTKDNLIQNINAISNNAKDRGIAHLYAQQVTGNKLLIKGNELLHFGSCSYLGLEFDARLIEGARQGLEQYGTQFSSSRAYVSCGLYEELEYYFEQIFESEIVIASTTTLGHLSAIPTLIGSDDAVILDHQVHSSVQSPVLSLKNSGITVEIIRHNDMAMLEHRIKKLKATHNRIWYMADGIYSMYGDKAPLDEIYALMNTYDQLHFYCDDAHGMSCYGSRGQGYVLNHSPIREKMVLAVSLAKAFATGGAVFAFKNKEWAQKFRNSGGPMMASGPMQPSTIGAAIESAKIHLSPEIELLQNKLHDNIKYVNLLIKKIGLPLVVENDSPVCFIGCSLPKVGYNLVEKMVKKGYLCNLGIFPAVPMKNTGMRFTITSLHNFEELSTFTHSLGTAFHQSLIEEQTTLLNIQKAFNLPTGSFEFSQENSKTNAKEALNLSHHTSITKLDPNTWDQLHGHLSLFDAKGLKQLEDVFLNGHLMEECWEFDYIQIKDSNGKIVLSTGLTTTLMKDDMLMPKHISENIEVVRKHTPYYLTSKVLSTGNPLSSGEHLFIDQQHHLWKKALKMFLKKVNSIRDTRNVDSVMIRDFNKNNEEINTIISDMGFFKMELPESYNIEHLAPTTQEYLNQLNSKKRKALKTEILDFEDYFDAIDINYKPDDKQLAHWYKLYSEVKEGNTDLNTFNLPQRFFESFSENDQWTVTELYLTTEYQNILGYKHSKPVAVFFNYACNGIFHMMIVGYDKYFKTISPYKQATYQSLKQAQSMGYQTLNLGFTCGLQKKKIGASEVKSWTYVQLKDHYQIARIESVHAFATQHQKLTL